jgi:hypothetical protein
VSVKHIGLVLDHLKVKPAVKLVAVVLADHADSDGVCWPSYRRIAEKAGCDERTARRHIKTLIELGVVTKLRTGTVMKIGDRTVKVTNAYRVNEDVLRRMPIFNAPKLSTKGLGMKDSFDHLEVDKNDTHRGGGLSTKPSNNHQHNRKSEDAVDNSDGISVGDVLNAMLADGRLG